MSLAHGLRLYGLISSLVLFGILGVVLMSSTSTLLRRQTQQAAREELALVQADLRRYIDERTVVLRDYASLPIVRQGVMQPDSRRASIVDYLETVRLLGERCPMALLDFEGRPIHVSTAFAAAAAADPASRLLAAGGGRELAWSRDTVGGALCTIAVPVAYGVSTEGVLLAQVRLGHLSDNSTGHGRLELLLDDDVVAAYGTPVDGPVVQVDDAQLGVALRYQVDGGPTRATLLRLAGYAAALLALTSAVVAVLAVIVGRRFLLRPLQRLGRYSQEVGHEEVVLPPPPLSITELDDLGAQLHDMAVRIMQRDAANAAKTRFLASVSHEIRTPLHGIMGLTELLRSTGLTPQQAERVTLIENSTERLVDMVGDVLDLTRVEAGMIELGTAPFDVHGLVAAVVAERRAAAESRGLWLESQVDAGVPRWVVGDRRHVSQVLGELLDNAVKFTESGSLQVQVSAGADGGGGPRLTLAVTDTGIGMSPQEQTRALAPFGQADASEARRNEGCGLGLPLSVRLVELMGGRLEMRSASAAGTRVAMVLPLVESSVPPLPDLDLEAVERRTIRVLLVEDNPVNQIVAADLLRLEGHEVAIAVDGECAVTMAMEGDYDIILMDVQLPGMSGVEATQRIRREEVASGRHVPIVALTAHALQGDEERFRQAGMDGCLPKPLSPGQLRKMVLKAADSGPAPPAPAPEHPQAEDLVDRAVWEDLRSREATGGVSLQLYVDVFLDDAPKRLSAMQDALAAGDLTSLEIAAHTLCGGARELGAPGLQALCRQIEDSATRGIAEGVDQHLQAASAELQAVEAEMRRRLAEAS
jgi:signal transduction histidine kinase/DNA-binding NarL/FixJ family response regulator/HPt (histidine-containing phosphotransfer) domain-containing protein